MRRPATPLLRDEGCDAVKRSLLNFWVDAIIGVAFLACAASGILFLLPLGVRGVSASGVATILGIGVPAWHAVHDWSAVTIVVGLGLHCALHYRWIVNMGRRAFGGLSAAGRAPQRTAPAARRRPVAPSGAPVTLYRASGTAPAAQSPASPAAKSKRTVAQPAGAERRYTRGAFLTGAAGLAGSALLVGLIAARGRSQAAVAANGSTAPSDVGSSSSSGAGSSSSSGSGDQQGDGYAYGYGDGTQQSGAAAAPGGGSTGARVVVDTGACIGCGACLQVCPVNVFAWSGGKAIAADPGACIRCGRCLQACPVSAITVA